MRYRETLLAPKKLRYTNLSRSKETTQASRACLLWLNLRTACPDVSQAGVLFYGLTIASKTPFTSAKSFTTSVLQLEMAIRHAFSPFHFVPLT